LDLVEPRRLIRVSERCVHERVESLFGFNTHDGLCSTSAVAGYARISIAQQRAPRSFEMKYVCFV
jgi:hypothetical protein